MTTKRPSGKPGPGGWRGFATALTFATFALLAASLATRKADPEPEAYVTVWNPPAEPVATMPPPIAIVPVSQDITPAATNDGNAQAPLAAALVQPTSDGPGIPTATASGDIQAPLATVPAQPTANVPVIPTADLITPRPPTAQPATPTTVAPQPERRIVVIPFPRARTRTS